MAFIFCRLLNKFSKKTLTKRSECACFVCNNMKHQHDFNVTPYHIDVIYDGTHCYCFKFYWSFAMRIYKMWICQKSHTLEHLCKHPASKEFSCKLLCHFAFTYQQSKWHEAVDFLALFRRISLRMKKLDVNPGRTHLQQKMS